jgi:hypothetical protein
VPQVPRILLAWQCTQSEPVEQLGLLALELREQLDSWARQGRAAGRLEPRAQRAKAQRAQQDYRVLTELQVLQDCEELLVAQARLETKVQPGLKVLLESEQADQLEQLVNKGQSAHRVLLEVSALAELLDWQAQLVQLAQVVALLARQVFLGQLAQPEFKVQLAQVGMLVLMELLAQQV